MLPTLRIGMVGHGFMGKVHGHAYRSLGFYYDPSPARCVLAGVATSSASSAERAVRDFGYEFGTSDWRELCARDDIDIIDVSVPNDMHRDVVIAALEAGKHVYCDKPLTTSLSQAREILAAADGRDAQAAGMTFQYRFVPALMRAKQLVEQGALGEIWSARVAYLHAGYVDPNRPRAWRLDASRSGPGGALFDLSSHVIDLSRWLLGEFASVQHLGETFIHERPATDGSDRLEPVEVDDISILLFRLAGGAIGTLESSRLATGVQDELRFEAHGSRGAIRFDLMQPNYLRFYDATASGGDYGGDRGFQEIECVQRYPAPAALPGPKSTIGWERFHVHCLWSFVRAIVEGCPADPSLLDGARTQAVLEAAVQSSREDRWVDVPEV